MTAVAIDQVASDKESKLQEWLRETESVLVGYSGGVDSTYLAVVAREVLGRENALAVLGRSASVPEDQLAAALSIANRQDIDVRVVDTSEVQDPRYAANPVNRCYFCKSVLWETLAPMARALGIRTVVDGTNADDLSEDRPGAQAAQEQGVESPLARFGLTKAEIRELSRARGLPTWSQPSSPCLASRIPYGSAVTAERLRQVELAERALRQLGITGNLRVRHHGELARIEMDLAVMNHWMDPDNAAKVATAVRDAGFSVVTIDPRGFRSGSLNVLHAEGPTVRASLSGD